MLHLILGRVLPFVEFWLSLQGIYHLLSLARKYSRHFGLLSQLLSLLSRPGTGKTTTLVEAIHQVVLADPKNRVLVCAPSNTATDLIASRLVEWHNNREIIRLNAPSRAYDALLPNLREFSPAVGRKFSTPPKDELKKFRIVVSTCYYASIPRALGIEDHFTHIFVDEAGNASEAELMVALLQNTSKKTNIVLSGDVSAFVATLVERSNLIVLLANATRPYCSVQGVRCPRYGC